ncbi:MAG: thiamine phosphate synthase [Acidobacteria bacterium]|nr:thiamine phosphate synthase [Acidobacteriota bacterium]
MWPPRTIVVTDRRRLSCGSSDDAASALVAFAAAVAAAGVDVVQIRERDWDDGTLVRVTRAVMRATAGSGCEVFVNERAHVAVAAGAHGMHLRGNGMPAARVRAAWPTGLRIGRSVHGSDQATVADGVDVALFGTVVPSVSKGGDAVIAGVAALAAWVGIAGATPVVAIGGIDVERCAAVRAAGACGVAGIDVFVRAWEQGGAALAALVREMHAVLGERERTQ